jgi:undecaprenyl-diphosphatase
LSLFHIFVVAVIQGITEFLPISSSGHLILIPELTDWPDQGRSVDVAVHVGTLFAVLLYFWRDAWDAFKGFFLLLVGHNTAGGRLAFALIVSTIPVVIAGFFAAKTGLIDQMRSVEVIGWTMLGFGIVLYVADKIGMRLHRMEHMTVSNAFIIGLAQVLALIPGTSRSGITMTAARFLGFEAHDAARFSMLMSIPTILAAGLLDGLALYGNDQLALGSDAVVTAALAFICAIAALAAMMAWLKHAGFTPFVIYRVLLGAGLLWWVYA